MVALSIQVVADASVYTEVDRAAVSLSVLIGAVCAGAGA